MPKKDARTLLARFNEQIEPIYALLRETEDVNLAYDHLNQNLQKFQPWNRGEYRLCTLTKNTFKLAVF